MMDDATSALLAPSTLDPETVDRASYARRLRGWLAYAFASKVFSICSLGLFLPILLEQFARDNGVLLPGHTEPCTTAVSGQVGPNGTLSDGAAEGARCVVRIGWAWVDTASFSLYVFSASVAIQALTVISMGGVADHPTHRKFLLLMFAALGSASATLFLLLSSHSPLWPLCALLAILANVTFGASVVMLNAYLPGLAHDAPEVLQEAKLCLDVRNRAAPESEYKDAIIEYNSVLSKAMSRISARGVALGYGAAILVLILLLIPVNVLNGSTFSLRLCIGITGIWWATFSVPTGIWLPSGKGFRSKSKDDNWSLWSEILKAWAELGRMLRPREMRKLRNTFVFLAAWFVLSDAITTISSTAILFAKTALHLPPSSLILIGILAPLSGAIGALTISHLQTRFRWSNLRVLMMIVLAVVAVPLYGCLGFVTQGFGGLRTAGEMYALALYYGFNMGALQSYARAVFAELIPPGQEARWFGLYSITDDSSSFLGPLVVGVIADATGNIRYAFFFLIVMVILPLPILSLLHMDKGREDADAFARERTRIEVDVEDQ